MICLFKINIREMPNTDNFLLIIFFSVLFESVNLIAIKKVVLLKKAIHYLITN